VAAFFAAAGIGACIVPINPLLKSEEIEHIISDSQATTLIAYEGNFAEAIKSQASNTVLQRILVSKTGQFSDSELQAQAKSAKLLVQELTRGTRPHRSVRWYDNFDLENDLALLVYTSGTTGKPKGAMLTNRSMLSIFPGRFDLFDICSKDKILATLPMCHIYGITILMIGMISRGGTLVILPRFEAPKALKVIQDEKVTLVPAVPAMFQFMLMELAQTKYDLAAVRLCFSGAAALPAEAIKQIETVFGATLIEGFGMTETSCVATINPLRGKRKAGSVGPVLPGVQMKVISEEGEELPAGREHVGEFWIKGPNIMRGYYKKEAESAEVLKDGWFATGDLGYKDEDGYFFIVGRKKEMIIRGGFNIYPREIEDVLQKMEQVAEAAVVGVPDHLMGERVKAVVVLKPGSSLNEDEVKAYCNEHLAEYKVPRLVEFCDSLPRNSTGKILKRLLSAAHHSTNTTTKA
jgi:long-chain acyl-CoA synthetase